MFRLPDTGQGTIGSPERFLGNVFRTAVPPVIVKRRGINRMLISLYQRGKRLGVTVKAPEYKFLIRKTHLISSPEI
jgi:hypothetical protein